MDTLQLNLIKLVLLFFITPFVKISGQKNDSTLFEPLHEVVLFIIPETKEIKWDSPSALIKSSTNCFLASEIMNSPYMLGHVITKVRSPLITTGYAYYAMNGADQSEKLSRFFTEKRGLGVLGCTMKGRLEPENEIISNLEFYAKKNKLSYMRFLVSEESVLRILEFINYYTSLNMSGIIPVNQYNGALFPGYFGEGAGCSAFAIHLLSLAGALPLTAKDEWLIEINMPMDLIGGDMNNNKRIKLKDILKRKEWHSGEGIEGVDFASFSIFDPYLIHKWVLKTYNSGDKEHYQPEKSLYNVKGLFVDYSDLRTYNDSITTVRLDTTFFIKHYFEKIKNNNNE